MLTEIFNKVRDIFQLVMQSTFKLDSIDRLTSLSIYSKTIFWLNEHQSCKENRHYIEKMIYIFTHQYHYTLLLLFQISLNTPFKNPHPYLDIYYI